MYGEAQAASGLGQYNPSDALVQKAPPSAFTIAVLNRLDEANALASQIGYSLVTTRDRVFGAQPELANGSSAVQSEPPAIAAQIEARLDTLVATLRRLDGHAEQLNARL